MRQIPLDAKIDKKGILYIDNPDVINYPIIFKRYYERLSSSNNECSFYELSSTNDYIIKMYPSGAKGRQIRIMLENFREIASNILFTDLPIGYYQEYNHIKGLIIPYYKNAPSLSQIIMEGDINELGKYYYHSDNNVHNLTILFLDILRIIEELYENDIYYTDVHPGNFVLYNNKVKLIDFDPQYVHCRERFDKNSMKSILHNYENLLYKLNKGLLDNILCVYRANNFNNMREYVKKLEKKIR